MDLFIGFLVTVIIFNFVEFLDDALRPQFLLSFQTYRTKVKNSSLGSVDAWWNWYTQQTYTI